ncbi:MAG: hypothetical protein KIT25_19550 [Enhydrobacter sp.]|nr:MAG: hypothetical protein KIT25_19550 [Enhydrobacter sp.]
MILCGDDELGYVASRTRFVAGRGLPLDDTYRLAHLPLVAPDHPRLIARDEGRGYVMGRHERVTSLVVPVPGEALRDFHYFNGRRSGEPNIWRQGRTPSCRAPPSENRTTVNCRVRPTASSLMASHGGHFSSQVA